jgi:hypothetical protein
MYTCERWRDLLWEDLYGLLEAGERDRLHDHLAGCNACQAALVQAQADQQELTSAARLDIFVPTFEAPSSDGAAFPHPLRAHDRAYRRRRVWVGLSAAAAVLALVVVPYGIYQVGLARQQAALVQAEKEVGQLLARRDEARKQTPNELEEKLKAGRLCLEVLGPANYTPGNGSPYRILTTDVDGKPAQAALTARLVDGDQRECWRESLVCNGTAALSLPAHLNLGMQSPAHLEIVASASGHDEKLQAELPISGAEFLTQLVIDKPVYLPGDRLFFRSLTLERYHLTPPGRALPVTYSLRGRQGAPLKTLSSATREDGIGGGDIVLPGNLADGEYTLAAQCGKSATVTRSFLIHASGASRNAGAPKAASSWGTLRVDFFPEGGDLVAGLPNRVYFRVRTPRGEPAPLSGRLLDSKDREVAAVTTVPQANCPGLGRGLGVFTFTPRAGEIYRLVGQEPSGYKANAELSARQAAEVGLSVPKAVTQAGEPVRVVLRQTAPERPLLISLSCRGRVVAEELVTSRPGETHVQLAPPLDCQGVLRVTVFDCQQDQPRPIAERLAYRAPAQRLLVSVEADKQQYRPGDHVRLKFSTTNEAGKAEPAWLLIAVVNRDALRLADDAADRSQPAYFYLTSELQQAQDLEDATFLLGDDAEAAQALDLVLGTHGWRRFSGSGIPTPLAANFTSDGGTLVKRDNTPQVKAEIATAVTVALADLRAEDRRLTEEGKRLLLEAQGGLARYQAAALEYVRMALGATAIALLLTGGFFSAVSLRRALQKLSIPRRYLAGAALSAVACMGLGWGSVRGFGQPDATASAADQLAEALRSPWDPARLSPRGTRPPIMSIIGSGAASLQGNEQSPAPRARPEIEMIQRSLPFSPSGEGGGSTSVPPGVAAPIREYAYLLPKDTGKAEDVGPDTILWQPVLLAGAGVAEVTFDLPRKAASYRVDVQGHSASGRLGAGQQDLSSK